MTNEETISLTTDETISLTTDAPVDFLPQQVSTGTQTDLTALDIAALEADYQQRVREGCSQVCTKKGFADQEDFKKDENLLRFYTGLNSFTVLMAVFNLVAPVIPEYPLSKLSKFQSFTLTLMKLRLNAANFDLAFRFGVSATTVGRILSRWIEAMNARLAFIVTWPDRESCKRQCNSVSE